VEGGGGRLTRLEDLAGRLKLIVSRDELRGHKNILLGTVNGKVIREKIRIDSWSLMASWRDSVLLRCFWW